MTRCEYLVDPTAGVYCDAEPAYRAEPHYYTYDGHDIATLGRPISHQLAYCSKHGGLRRSIRERDASWHYLAPASVGDESAVLDAGTWALDSTCVYLVIRRHAYEALPERVEVIMTDRAHNTLQTRHAPFFAGWACPRRTLGPDWRVELRRIACLAPGEIAVPSAPRQAITDEEIERLQRAGVISSLKVLRPRVRKRARPYAVSLGVRSYARLVGEFANDPEALAQGRAAWRSHVDRTVECIRQARGGTLDWGMPVRPLAEPIIVRPEPGESAWDALARLAP